MPKLKRVSAAHSARLATMRKRRQREDLVKRQQERERDAQRYLRSRLLSHPEVNSEERGREHTAEAHGSERIDPEILGQHEQECNVSSRQLLVDDRERRREEQVLLL